MRKLRNYLPIWALDVIDGISNFIKFRKVIYRWRWWDRGYFIDLIIPFLEDMANKTEAYGIEVESSRMKKVAKMRRVIQLLKSHQADDYTDRAELILGVTMPPFEMRWKPYHPETIEEKKFLEKDSADPDGLMELIDDRTENELDVTQSIYDKAKEIEETEWTEIWQIFKGQDRSEYNESIHGDYHDWLDGSDLRSWWD